MFPKKLIIVVALFFTSLSLFSKTVKVGYYIDAGNFMSGFSENDAKAGYAYEYLQTVSSYTGWKYEYKYGYWPELYQALQTGEIDILADVSYTKEREKILLFPDYKMGTESYYIYANGSRSDIIPGEIKSLDGKSIGLDEGSFQYDLFNEWIKNKKIDCKKVIFPEDVSGSEQAFNDGEFDLYLAIDTVASFFWEPIVKVGESDFYLAVNKNREDLLHELNEALGQLYMVSPYYNTALWEKYFSDVTTSKKLTNLENEWLNNKLRVINIGYINNDLPFASAGKEGCEGLLPGIVSSLRNYFNIDSVTINYVPFNDYMELSNAIKNKTVDAGFPFYKDPAYSEINGLINSNPVTSIPVGYICHKDKSAYSFYTTGVVPFSRNSYITEKFFPNYEEKTLNNDYESLELISKGKIDCALFDMYKIQALLYGQRKYNNLKFVSIPENYEICFSLIPENYSLCTLLNKLLVTIPQSEVNLIIEQNLIKNSKYTFNQFIQDYLVVIVTIILIIVVLAFALLFTIEKLFEYINYDTLTHMLNRRRLDTYIKKFVHHADDKDKPFSIVLFDLDGFKEINDTHGHECGDKVLKSIAGIINNNIRDCDYGFRWGGEEFLLLLSCDSKDSVAIAERIRMEIEESYILYNDINIKVTATAGCVEYEKGMPYSQMFVTADKKLYKGKSSGKNVVIA